MTLDRSLPVVCLLLVATWSSPTSAQAVIVTQSQCVRVVTDPDLGTCPPSVETEFRTFGIRRPDATCPIPFVGIRGLACDTLSETVYVSQQFGTPATFPIRAFRMRGHAQFTHELGSRVVAGLVPEHLGFDESSRLLWGSDGTDCCAWDFSVVPRVCGEVSVAPSVGPFPAPAGFGLVQDLDWDPFSGSLWLLMAEPTAINSGHAVNVDAAGNLLGSFPVSVATIFSLVPFGLAFDRASGVGGHMYISFGPTNPGTTIHVGYQTDGQPAPDTGGLTNLFNHGGVGPQLWHLADSAFLPSGTQFHYPNTDFLAPSYRLATVGYPRSPNSAFAHQVRGNAQQSSGCGVIRYIAFSTSPACPTFPVDLYTPQGSQTFTRVDMGLSLSGFVSAVVPSFSGEAPDYVRTPLAPGIPAGTEIYAQAIATESIQSFDPVESSVVVWRVLN